MRNREDAVRTYITTLETPVMHPALQWSYWDEVAGQVNALIGKKSAQKLAQILETDKVFNALYRKSEQTRVDLIIMLQRQGRI